MSEVHIKHVPPVPEYFSVTMDRGAAFDLIVALRSAVELLENLPESLPEILEAFEDQYQGDLPDGIAPLVVTDGVDDDACAA